MRYEEFAELALSYLNQLYRAARRQCASTHDADDLVQETYRLAFEHYRDLRSLAHCRAWLYRILHRQAATLHRRNRAAPILVEVGAEATQELGPPSVADDALEHVALDEIRNAIAALPPDLRVAVTLCDVEGFTYDEIADITDCPVGTVRSRIARARAKLMTQLQANAAALGIRRQRA
jgi:RNA polymerase sigma-70 factor (ECF subfamily)